MLYRRYSSAIFGAHVRDLSKKKKNKRRNEKPSHHDWNFYAGWKEEEMP